MTDIETAAYEIASALERDVERAAWCATALRIMLDGTADERRDAFTIVETELTSSLNALTERVDELILLLRPRRGAVDEDRSD